MDSRQIEEKLKNQPIFNGAFPRDKLPKLFQIPAALIVNTDSSSEKGEHWIAIIVLKYRRGEYFDSFGIAPLHKDIISFLDKHCSAGWIFNSCCIQHYSSKSCGNHCIAYIKERISGKSFTEFISQFSVNLSKNEELISKWN